MQSKIPVPTDNIYKFLATFGLVIMVSSLGLIVYLYESTNAIAWESANKIYDLDAGDDPYKEERARFLSKKVEIAVSNRGVGGWFLSGLFVLGFCSSFEGFRRWHREIQPMHDDIVKLQKKKLELEVELLTKQSNKLRPLRRTP